MAAEGVSSRITRLNQLLSGKTSGRKVPLLDKETLLDAFMALYNECNTEFMLKEKNIATYVTKFKSLICELEKLRLKKSDFEIRKTIGRGHFGEVHVVREKITGNVYAMKVLKKSATLSQDNVAFFEEERDIMAFANNPWITSLQYAFQDFESLYLVMDFHPGGDLLSLLAKYDDIFEEDVAQFYLAEMVIAIHAIHAIGYVHRDIKPENVLIDRVGHIKLADFGSSARLSSAKTVVSKMPVGTPEYIAPEVLTSMDGSGGGGKYGIECDWWSLGVVAYEMMVGNTPFQADSVVVVYSQIMNFKNSLVFPDDEPLTDNAKCLIRGLLTDQKNRIGYADLAQHPFFSGMDWTTLHDAVPPYVPTIAREDDTSNFDDFETENGGPRIDDFMEKKKGFLGKDLPFIGFTFTKQLTMASLNEVVEPGTPTGALPKTPLKGRESFKQDNTANNAQLLILKNDIEKEQKKTKELQQKLDDKTKSIEKLESERDNLENEKAVFETEKKDLERNLHNEKSEREKAEKEVQSIRKEVQDLNKKVEELRSNQSSVEELEILEKEKLNLSSKVQNLENQLLNYEKQIEDSKSRVSDLQTKLSKVNEDTKANVSELQQKLQKVTADNENRIKQFQEKLAKAVESAQETADQLIKTEHEKEDLEKELQVLQAFKDQFKLLESEKEGIKMQSTEQVKNLEKELADKNEECKNLQNETKSLRSDLQDAVKKYDKLVDFGGELKDQAERKIEKLHKELEKSRKNQKKIEGEYKELKEEFEDKNNNLNTKDTTIANLQGTCTSLEKQLNDLMNAKEMSAKELDQKVKEERLQLSRRTSQLEAEKLKRENELNQLRSELKEAQETANRNKQRLDEDRNQHDENVENLESMIGKLNKDVTKLNDECVSYQRDIAAARKVQEDLESKVTSLQSELDSANGKAEESEKSKVIEDELKKTNIAIENLQADKKVLESKLATQLEEFAKVSKEKDQLQEELNEKERRADSQDLTIQMLKQTVTMLEGQVEELEVMNDEYQDREAQWNLTKRQHYQAQENFEQQLTEALNQVETYRQQKNRAEEKLRESEETGGSSKSELEDKIKELNETITQKEDKLQKLQSSLSAAEKKNRLNSVAIKNIERKLATEQEEKERFSLEITQLEDLSAQQTSSNFTLTVEIEDLKEREEEMLLEKENLRNELERNAFSFAEEKIKLESQLAQQTKLIDLLQKKVMIDDRNFAPLHRKKGGRLFGKGKPDAAPQQQQQHNADARKTRDLERALEKEKNSNLQMHLQLQKAREELTTLRSEISQLRSSSRSPSNPATPRLSHKEAIKTVSTSSVFVKSSPSTSVADIYQLAANEVRGSVSSLDTKANKTHHLQQTLNMRASKCPVCLNTVPFARQISKCTDCHLVCHPDCAPSLQNLCGVPNTLLPQFAMGLNRTSLILDDGSVAIDITSSSRIPRIEGWLKFPRSGSSNKNSWERKWVVLHEMKLSIYENENTIEFDPFDEIDLNITEGELNIHPAIPASELLWASSNDLVYVFSVELLPYTLGWPRRTLYFLPPTFADKQKWVGGLEMIADEVKRSTQKQGHGMADDVILTIEGAKHINVSSAVMLKNSGSILGCEDGLYVVSFKTGNLSHLPVPIPGLGPVHQLTLVKELDIALVIAGKDRLFCYINLEDLRNRLKQLQNGSSISAISSHQIDKVKNCHLFTVAKLNDDYYAAAATYHKLNILKYNTSFQTFILLKEVETTEPCTCLLLTSDSVVYGTGKFYSVDLTSFHKKDFLDASDTSLAFAVFGATQTRSYPIAIIKVSRKAKREEYLLCYNEFGVFVDWQGRRSRKGDLKWSRLPLSFEYYHPHLYISHFASIEICEILSDAKADISTTPRRYVDVPEPRFLGDGLDDNSVLVASSQKNKLEIIQYQDVVSTNGHLSRNVSTLSGVSGLSVANAILEKSNISADPVIRRSDSSNSKDSDEETASAINRASNAPFTPRDKRKDQLRSQEKDKNRISFRFFKSNRKSQYDGH